MICLELNLDKGWLCRKNVFHLVKLVTVIMTVTPFNANLKVHIRQFYVNGNGEMKVSRIGVTLSLLKNLMNW